jgi:hypothetical protein
VCFFECIFIL